MARTTIKQLEELVTSQQTLIRDLSQRVTALEAAEALAVGVADAKLSGRAAKQFRVDLLSHQGTVVLGRKLFATHAEAVAALAGSPPSKKVYAKAKITSIAVH